MSDFFTKKNDELHVEDIPLATIAKNYGTPAYVYSAASIRDQFEKLSGAMQRALPADRQPLMCYACKANSNIAILKIIQKLGSSVEVVSKGELLRALKAGFDPEKIVFEGVGKTREDIEAGLNANVHQFNIESLAEMELINTIAAEQNKTAHITFRLNPDVGGGAYAKITTGKKGDKFGLSYDRVIEGYKRAATLENINARGVFIHIGSQITDADFFHEVFKRLAEFVHTIRDQGFTVSHLDIGGGFPIQYRDEESLLDLDTYANAVRDIILPLNVEIIMEPGRYLVGNAGILLTKVLYEKESHGDNFLVVDSSMSELMRPALYGAWHEIEPVDNENTETKTYTVVGPVCESSDIFAKDRKLPAMAQGDLVILRSTGAYGFCMASNYNTRLLPPEILVDGDKVEIIRPRQTYEDIIDVETIPEWLK